MPMMYSPADFQVTICGQAEARVLVYGLWRGEIHGENEQSRETADDVQLQGRLRRVICNKRVPVPPTREPWRTVPNQISRECEARPITYSCASVRASLHPTRRLGRRPDATLRAVDQSPLRVSHLRTRTDKGVALTLPYAGWQREPRRYPAWYATPDHGLGSMIAFYLPAA